MNTRNILLVEDDPCDVVLTLAALEEHHTASHVFVVHDGVEALDYLFCRNKYEARTGANPAVVLLDNKMPKLSGLEVLKVMKADPELKSIPVVVLTSSRETPDLVEFYKYGVNAYVVKPVVYAEFIAAIKQLGVFWGLINEPPPDTKARQKAASAPPLAAPEKESEIIHAIAAPNSALGG